MNEYQDTISLLEYNYRLHCIE